MRAKVALDSHLNTFLFFMSQLSYDRPQRTQGPIITSGHSLWGVLVPYPHILLAQAKGVSNLKIHPSLNHHRHKMLMSPSKV